MEASNKQQILTSLRMTTFQLGFVFGWAWCSAGSPVRLRFRRGLVAGCGNLKGSVWALIWRLDCGRRGYLAALRLARAWARLAEMAWARLAAVPLEVETVVPPTVSESKVSVTPV